MLERRNSVTQNSTLSNNNMIFTDSDVTVNLNLNGNLLYRITENGNTTLYEDNQFVRTEDSVTFKKNYLNSLDVNQYKNIVFEFTDGNTQTLKITRKVNLPEVSVSGKFALDQTVSAVLNGTDVSSGITYQWQISENGNDWTNITNATGSSYTISNNAYLKYLRVKINSQDNSTYVYPQEKCSPQSSNKIIRYGDVNFDGNVGITDATLIQKYLVGMIEFNNEQFVAADVDGDNHITVTDSNYISKYSSGVIDVFPVESN